MARIDTSKIEGYANMTPEQKLAALEAFDIDDTETAKLKEAVTKANREAAESKRLLREKQTAEEIERAEREAKYAEQEELLKKLQRQQIVSEYAERYRKQGYDDKLAMETAEALADGKTDIVFKNAETFKTNLEKSIRADVTRGTPHPNHGGESTPKTRAEIMKIRDSAERQKAIAENIHLFDKE